jgi:hypothetical protein
LFKPRQAEAHEGISYSGGYGDRATADLEDSGGVPNEEHDLVPVADKTREPRQNFWMLPSIRKFWIDVHVELVRDLLVARSEDNVTSVGPHGRRHPVRFVELLAGEPGAVEEATTLRLVRPTTSRVEGAPTGLHVFTEVTGRLGYLLDVKELAACRTAIASQSYFALSSHFTLYVYAILQKM